MKTYGPSCVYRGMESRSPAAAALLLCACVPPAQTVEPECVPALAAQEDSPAPAVERQEPCDRCCTAIDHEGPEIVDAGWDPSGAIVELTFSKPVKGVKGISPKQFRLSFASASEGEGDAEVSYYDPLYYFDEGKAGGDDDEPELLHVVELQPVDDLHIRLKVSHPIEAESCEDLELATAEELEEGEFEGVFLHYTNARKGIEDGAGNRMRSFGAAWANHPRSVHAAATGAPPVHRIDLLIPVQCMEAKD